MIVGPVELHGDPESVLNGVLIICSHEAVKGSHNLFISSSISPNPCQFPWHPHFLFSKETNVGLVEISEVTLMSHTMLDTNPVPGAECGDRSEIHISDM